MRAIRFIAFASLACWLCGLGVGCNREEPIRAYQTPHEAVEVHHDRVEWTTPGSWVEWPAERPEIVGFTIDEQSPPIQMAFSSLERTSPSAADVLANVNRWERQVGIPLSTPEQADKVVTKVPLGGRTANVVDLLGPPGGDQKRLFAAMIVDGNEVWFFKTMGPAARMAAHKSEWDQFISSVKINGPKETGPQRQYKPPLSWIVPEGWENGGDVEMRHQTFYAGNPADPAEIIVTGMGGAFGDMLSNINRWRAQVGLAPVSKDSDQPTERMQVAGNPAAYFDFVGPGNASAPNRRMLIVMCAVKNQVWFFKMLGPQATVEAEKQHFDEFIKSVEFTEQK
jgi:hypothetical protein